MSLSVLGTQVSAEDASRFVLWSRSVFSASVVNSLAVFPTLCRQLFSVLTCAVLRLSGAESHRCLLVCFWRNGLAKTTLQNHKPV